jgi:hypothetical protein
LIFNPGVKTIYPRDGLCKNAPRWNITTSVLFYVVVV